MSEWAIETKGLGKQFGRKWAVRDLELHVPKGSVIGLLGPNGVGKTTTIQMLMGLLPPTKGTMSVLGIDPVKNAVGVKRRAGYVSEIHGFYEWMKVDELIGFVAPYHRDWEWDTCRTLLEEFGLEGNAQVKTLSKGTRGKLALLLALSFNPEMLILDEPTGGLDPAARRSFIETILARYQESDKTILVASHLMNEFAGLLDYVAFLKDGRLHLESSMEDLHRKVKRARLVFPDEVPAGFSVNGGAIVKKGRREVLVTFQDFDPERTPAELAATGATNVSIDEMTLEDIFVDLVGTPC
jgi:ABC-2 type transport system ATP-binding protein